MKRIIMRVGTLAAVMVFLFNCRIQDPAENSNTTGYDILWVTDTLTLDSLGEWSFNSIKVHHPESLDMHWITKTEQETVFCTYAITEDSINPDTLKVFGLYFPGGSLVDTFDMVFLSERSDTAWTLTAQNPEAIEYFSIHFLETAAVFHRKEIIHTFVVD